MARRKATARKHEHEVLDTGRVEMEKAVPDPEVLGEFRDAGRLGNEPQELKIKETKMSPLPGDPDITLESSAVDDESPGGDQPTPDENVVEEVGKAEGITYEDNETLRPLEKIAERDRKRWELDPASSENYRERSKHEGETEE